MAFDAATYPAGKTDAITLGTLIETSIAAYPAWAAENPDRALALLFVAPRDCMAVDVLFRL